ncbi:GNAT family N-acetyltransferase [Crenobacter luteus]|uniref:GNAT family N-acetyltransferase n=1 Tax=Crenobacter luteus TaxID=1452487 RepID=UPI0009ED81EB|nr:GNAT family N-acetyltransferase [Crenobacter luteus]
MGISGYDAVSAIEAWPSPEGPGGLFVGTAWLAALEASGAVGRGSGWRPLPLFDAAARLACPVYLKGHSYGEYVFDWAWAEAYARAGLAYYPKLVVASPFTPITGPRFLGDAAGRAALIGALEELQDAHAIGSAHVLFPTGDEAQTLAERGWLLRDGVQFHWANRGYRDFDDFLDTLSRDKRKKIRQERRRVIDAGVTVRVMDGHAATPDDWAFFAACYANTYREHRSSPYLNRDFFDRVGRALPGAVRLVVAERQDRPVAASWFLADGGRLYGRYWGATEPVDCLHFELCYYVGIEIAIAERLAVFEGGAQGEHKLARGFEPVFTCSAHRIADPRFADAIAAWLRHERAGVAAYHADCLAHRAYRLSG